MSTGLARLLLEMRRLRDLGNRVRWIGVGRRWSRGYRRWRRRYGFRRWRDWFRHGVRRNRIGPGTRRGVVRQRKRIDHAGRVPQYSVRQP